MGLTTTTTHLKEFALTTEDLQLEITVSSAIDGSQSTIGWGQSQRPRSAGGKGQRS
jgi:hypothetical protein